MPLYEVVSNDKNCAIAVYGNAVIVDMRGDLTLGHVRSIGETYNRRRAEYDQLVTLVVAREGVPLASAEARAEGAAVGRETASVVVHIAVVFEDTGLLVQILRTALRGFSIIAKSTPLRVYPDLKAGIAGLRPFVPEQLRGNFDAHVMRVLQGLRAQLPLESEVTPPRGG